MNWIAVNDRLPPHGEPVLTESYDGPATAVYMKGHWYLWSQDEIAKEGYNKPCGMGCCSEFVEEDKELEWTPTHWCEIQSPLE